MLNHILSLPGVVPTTLLNPHPTGQKEKKVGEALILLLVVIILIVLAKGK